MIVAKQTTRRKLLTQSAQLAAAIGAGLPVFDAETLTKDLSSRSKQLRVVVAGAHPDDPETGCGGTIARYTGAGHKVMVL